MNKNTGEALETDTVCIPKGSIIYTPVQQEAYRRKMKNRQESYFRRKNNEPLGNFFFIPLEECFNDISPETVTRLIYLNTFTKYNSSQLMLTQRTPMKVTDLTFVLNVSKSTVIRFLEEACPYYLTIQGDNLIFTNREIFKKGCFKRGEEYTEHQKFYIDSVRQLYKSTPISNHKHLGYLFKLIPFINIEYNIICHNALETDLEKISLMSMKDFCVKINYDVSHLNRLLDIYRNIYFEVDGHRERFCSITYDGISKQNAKIFINPHILYCGSNYEKVKILGAFF